MTFYIRPLASRMERYTATSMKLDKWVMLNLYGNNYIIAKKNHMIADRVTAINLVPTE